MTTSSLPRYLLRSDLRDFYGLSRGAIDSYQRRGLLPRPDAVCSTGLLWSHQTLRDARRSMIPTLAAAVPIDDELGADDLDYANVYMCPTQSGHFIGWTTPSIIGLVESGNVAQWHSVLACARYDGSAAYETSTTDPVIQDKLDRARERRLEEQHLTVFLLNNQPLGIGPIKVSVNSKTAGLQRGRLLLRDNNRVGAPGAWLQLPPAPSSQPLPAFTLPLLDATFPMT
ncbi:hypothetical protein [Rhodococcus sp. 27YEA6]|uniref:hypothetical protein n=1 Tax=Rhodococcus sp. 27YEA6 TaxID=3156273 RepID=UPI0038327ED7